MSDRELIIGLLERIERRMRANRFLKRIGASLSIALAFPIAFKLLDLVWPFQARTVTGFFVVWAIATILFIGWKVLGGRDSLPEVAARLDQKAGMRDQLKTAYWFIRHPSQSPWVD